MNNDLLKRFWLPIESSLFNEWTNNFQNNLYPNVLGSLNEDMQPIPVNILQIRSFAQSLGSEKIYFHFVRKDGKTSIALESKNSQGAPIFKEIDNLGNIIDVSEIEFNSIKANYMNDMLPFLESITNINQTEYTVCYANEMYSCIQNTPIPNETIGHFYFAVINQTSTQDENILRLINNSNGMLVFILKFIDSTGNVLYFDANHTYPPGIL